ncbi:hypothetical protein CK203_001547 [Vitis vinifera]|uniref:Uncharacterized protein n=1 Tax=Vitis vinifera TaxID=29760 RepID=A0A438KKT1_VITVI|nr:hypothetical protein CK203_001547 [Vitis vinifera]
MANSDSTPPLPVVAPLSSLKCFPMLSQQPNGYLLTESESLELELEFVCRDLRKENVTPIGSKIAELNESRTELLSRIQGLKQDLQSWRSKLDTQVKVYRDLSVVTLPEISWELSELKKSLNGEVEQLRSEFQDLRTTLQQQQEDVTASLRNLGVSLPSLILQKLLQLQDVSGDAKEVQDTKEAEDTKVDANDKEVQAAAKENGKETEN